MKKLNDEQLLNLLLTHGSVSEAAAAGNITQRAVFQRLQNPAFRQKYDELRALSMENVTTKLGDSVGTAVNLLREIVENKSAPPSLRVQAADCLLRHTLKYAEFVTLSRRVAELETKLKESEEVD
jgi:hypothetical protein